jgi:DNA (cytosine-5)-methyltransferase 1
VNVALRPRPERLDIISLCTGGFGLDFAVELAIPCARTVLMVEREAFAIAHLVAAIEQGRLAPAAIWSDVRSLDGRAWRGLVDGVIGGIPCQPHSLAGKRLGREDPRDLWSAARRIIVQSGAWFVLIENVGGMLSSGGAERVIRDLERLGFACEIGLFTASEVGASHQRERLFILGVHDMLADTRCGGVERWGGARDVLRAAGTGAPAASERQWHGRPAGDGSESLADAERNGWGQGLCGASLQGRQSQPHHGSDALVDAASVGWREGRAEPELRSGWNAAAGAGEPVVYAEPVGRDWRSSEPIGRSPERASDEWSGEGALFPPGPDDLPSWQSAIARAPELEPAFRRVADGLASRLDFARIDRLRMLGNGVVSLEGAYALRTLATRLTGNGSAGAARLVRMMEAT